MASNQYRVNFRIRSSDNVEDELDRLADILTRKYKRQIRIALREVQRR